MEGVNNPTDLYYKPILTPMPEEKEDDQTCSAACSKNNVNLLARQLVAEVIGTYFLVGTVGLTSAQGLELGPIAVGNDDNLESFGFEIIDMIGEMIFYETAAGPHNLV